MKENFYSEKVNHRSLLKNQHEMKKVKSSGKRHGEMKRMIKEMIMDTEQKYIETNRNGTT